VSRARAEQVASYLAGNGISRERMDVGWFGADYLARADADPQSKALNRRAEIVVLLDY
jgi:outer membrane protein OmpA-like peptidoglycan-associated protein